MTTRSWLVENGYQDVVRLIDKVEDGWKANGVATRRNWWDILSGGRDGQARTVSGITFPVLATAQAHEGKPVTRNACRRSTSETPPEKDYRGRSVSKRKPHGDRSHR